MSGKMTDVAGNSYFFETSISHSTHGPTAGSVILQLAAARAHGRCELLALLHAAQGGAEILTFSQKILFKVAVFWSLCLWGKTSGECCCLEHLSFCCLVV